jgi:hypothetical protein
MQYAVETLGQHGPGVLDGAFDEPATGGDRIQVAGGQVI